MPIDLAQFHETFYEESFEAIAVMEQELLRLDVGERDPNLIHTIFRAAHSIKGGAATFGFQSISSFTHSLEALLDEVRGGRLQLMQPLAQLLLRAVDVLRGMLSAQRARLSINPQQIVDLQFEMERACAQQRPLLSVQGDSGAGGGAGAAAHAASDASAAVSADAVTGAALVASPAADAPADAPQAARRGLRRYDISVRPLPHLFSRRHDPLRLFRGLQALGELRVHADVTALPPLQEFDPESCYLSWSLQLQTTASRQAILEVFEWTEGDCALDVTAIEEPAATPIEYAAAEPRTAGRPPIERQRAEQPTSVRDDGGDRPDAGLALAARAPDSTSIRVSVDKIDQLMNSVSELVITQSMLAQLGARLGGTAAERMRAGLEQLERHVRDLQEHVMRMRMVPIGSVFNRFPRMVRDLSQRLAKQVELKVSGAETELDKGVLEKIGDPLMHLVRNCLDHGIEAPDRRRASGKPARGTIHLHACHRGSSVQVEIGDDGAGLDRERILAKARELGVVAASESPSDEAICNLIFVAGLSTNEQATLVSGRGVGMDVVKRNVEALSGRIELQSRPGQGTRFIVTLPLTLAIVDGQSVAVGDECYIVPLTAIVESVQLRTAVLKQLVGRGEVLAFRGDYVPVMRLEQQLFGGTVARAHAQARAPLSEIVMVVEADGKRIGLIVDALLGQQQVVIKTLEANYGQVEGIAGATILGDGSVALILDVERLIHGLAERLAA